MNVRKQKNVLNQNDVELVKTVSIFAVQVYLKPWFTACNALSAPGQIKGLSGRFCLKFFLRNHCETTLAIF